MKWRSYEKPLFLYGGPYRFSVATHPPPPSLQHVAFWKVCPPSSPELMRNRHPGREALSQIGLQNPLFLQLLRRCKKNSSNHAQSQFVMSCHIVSLQSFPPQPTKSFFLILLTSNTIQISLSFLTPEGNVPWWHLPLYRNRSPAQRPGQTSPDQLEGGFKSLELKHDEFCLFC